MLLHSPAPAPRFDHGRPLFLGKPGLERYLAVFQNMHHRVLVLPANQAHAFNGMEMHRDRWGRRLDLVCRSCEPTGTAAPRGSFPKRLKVPLFHERMAFFQANVLE
jgi:hypothetical protein